MEMDSVVSFYGNLHVWSQKTKLSQTGEDHLGVHTYHDKNEASNDEYKYYKKQWMERRGILWHLPNRRPEKLRDSLHDLEEILEGSSIAAIKWKSFRHLQIMTDAAVFIQITVSFFSGDVEKISIDKSLAAKISDQISDCILEEQYLVFSFTEKSKLAYVYFTKKPSPDKKEGEKLALLEPKVQVIDVSGPPGQRVNRQLTSNSIGDLIIVWWSSSSEEAWPWAPVVLNHDRANVVLLGVSSTKLDILAYLRTDNDPMSVQFSFSQPQLIYTVEQSQSSSKSYTIDSNIYEFSNNRIEKVSSTPISSRVRVVAHGRNHTADKLLLACEDGTLIMQDDHRRVNQVTKATLIPHLVCWHPTDTVVIVASIKGEIQVFDMALSQVPVQLSSDTPLPMSSLRLGNYLLDPVKLENIAWAYDMGLNSGPDAIGCYDDLMILCDRGPLCMFRFELGILSQGRLGPVELVTEYIKNDQDYEAVCFLSSMNWNTSGKACFSCLTIIADYLFQFPLSVEKEGLLEDALGSFYAPSRPLSEITVLQYRDPVSRLARRFFHHLLRHKRFEKAFLLAVDIGAKDLFMDIHYLANDVGNDALADASKERAMQIHQQEMAEGEISDEDYPVFESKEPSNNNGFLGKDGRPDITTGANLGVTSNGGSQSPERKISDRSRRKVGIGSWTLTSSSHGDTSLAAPSGSEEDPVAWALASRSGYVEEHRRRREEERRKSSSKEDSAFQLIHFGLV